MPSIGDRVIAQWPAEKSWWYPGVVVSDGGQIEVQFDDGDRAVLGPDQMKSLAIGPGSRVHCRWKGGSSYYPGKVSDARGSAIHVNYDDGDQEWSSVCMVRVSQNDL
jgi:hypothetical protein